MLKQIFNLLKLLNSDKGHNQIASGIAAGFLWGLSPLLSLQSLLLFLLVLFFRIQLAVALIFSFMFSLLAYLFDPLADLLGQRLLEAESMQSLWTSLYNLPLIPLTHFNNSVVMGSGVLGILFFIPVFFLSRYLVIKYREHIWNRIQNSKLWHLVRATGLYKFYAKYDELYGNRGLS